MKKSEIYDAAIQCLLKHGAEVNSAVKCLMKYKKLELIKEKELKSNPLLTPRGN